MWIGLIGWNKQMIYPSTPLSLSSTPRTVVIPPQWQMILLLFCQQRQRQQNRPRTPLRGQDIGLVVAESADGNNFDTPEFQRP